MKCVEIPALIDPHVHYRVPGGEHKEDWKRGALAAVRSGVTTVLDMPNNTPSTVTLEQLQEKKRLIEAQLRAVGLPLRYGLYLGADKNHLDEIERAAGEAVALKVFMGSSTGSLLIDTDTDLDEVFKRAAAVDMLVAVHAEDETRLRARTAYFKGSLDPSAHSQIRDRECAIRATARAIEKAAQHKARLYIVHLSTKEELDLVRQAKREGIEVYAEAIIPHLFLTVEDYALWKTFVQINPPLRELEDQEALWEGIRTGVIDTVGTDHAPHTLAEKEQPYGKAPSGMPGVEMRLPLLLDAVNKKKLTLERLIEVTRTHVEKIFRLPPNDDTVWVDLEWIEEIKQNTLQSKCGWSPFVGRKLKGWPLKTRLKGREIPIRGKIEGRPQTSPEQAVAGPLG